MIINQVQQGDCKELLQDILENSIHAIISDIPYGIGIDDWDVLHQNTNRAYLGSSPAQANGGSTFKKRGKPINGWSEADRLIPYEYQNWCATWAAECFRVLKPGGSALIFSGRRFSHRCTNAFEDSGFLVKDTLAWVKDKAPHRAQRISVVFDRRGNEDASQEWEGWRVGNLRPLYEPILWFVKPYPIGTTIADNILLHGVGAYNNDAFHKYCKVQENIIFAGLNKNEGGLHPTQKPLKLMKALIELVTKENQIILDPFMGSGTTLVAAKQLNRHYIGFDQNSDYVQITRERLNESNELQLLYKKELDSSYS
jgi:site-specific DNA-methyltransferase (adenine-specific)